MLSAYTWNTMKYSVRNCVASFVLQAKRAVGVRQGTTPSLAWEQAEYNGKCQGYTLLSHSKTAAVIVQGRLYSRSAVYPCKQYSRSAWGQQSFAVCSVSHCSWRCEYRKIISPYAWAKDRRSHITWSMHKPTSWSPRASTRRAVSVYV